MTSIAEGSIVTMAKLLRAWWWLIILVVLICFMAVQWSLPNLTSRHLTSCHSDFTTASNLENLVGSETTRRCHSISRPTEMRHKNSTWTSLRLRLSTNMVMDLDIFSAYYDERTSKRELPTVRLVLTSSGDLRNRDLYCQLWYPTASQPHLLRTKAVALDLQDKTSQTGASPSQYIVSCGVFSTAAKPGLVSLTATRCQNATNAIRVATPLHTRAQHELGVCSVGGVVVGGSGRWLVEWMELHRLLGVGHVTAYNVTLPYKAGLVIENYIMAGQADLIQIHPGGRHETYPSATSLKQVAINDCLLMNMYRYRAIIVVDYDQIIIPMDSSKDPSYTQLVSALGISTAAIMTFETYHDVHRVTGGYPGNTHSDVRTSMSRHELITSSPAFIVNADFCSYVVGLACEAVRTNSTAKKHNAAGGSVYIFHDCSLVHRPPCAGVQTNSLRQAKFGLKHRERLAERVRRRLELIRLEYNW